MVLFSYLLNKKKSPTLIKIFVEKIITDIAKKNQKNLLCLEFTVKKNKFQKKKF